MCHSRLFIVFSVDAEAYKRMFFSTEYAQDSSSVEHGYVADGAKTCDVDARKHD